MTSSPPSTADAHSPALVSLSSAAAGVLEEGLIFFSVEGAPTAACRTTTGPDGSLTFTTTLRGRVTSVDTDELVLAVGDRRVVVRHFVPDAIDWSGLLEHLVLVTVKQRYQGRGRATIDAEVRDTAGRLVLWARDGRLPSDDEARGFALRVSLDSDGNHRLAISGDRGVVSIASPGTARIDCDGLIHTALLVRLGRDDASFVILRG